MQLIFWYTGYTLNWMNFLLKTVSLGWTFCIILPSGPTDQQPNLTMDVLIDLGSRDTISTYMVFLITSLFTTFFLFENSVILVIVKNYFDGIHRLVQLNLRPSSSTKFLGWSKESNHSLSSSIVAFRLFQLFENSLLRER